MGLVLRCISAVGSQRIRHVSHLQHLLSGVGECELSRTVPSHSLTMTINEACVYMRVSRSTIYKLASAGKLPIRKVAGRSLILRHDIHVLLGVA